METALKLIDKQNTQTNTDLALKNAHAHIYSMNLDMVIETLTRKYKWLNSEAEEASRQYRNYLWLLKKYGLNQPLAPTEDIDEFWHHHILHTKKYREDCNNIFANYLDHTPISHSQEKSAASNSPDPFEAMQNLYQKEFGHTCPAARYKFRIILKLLSKLKKVR